MEFAILQYDGAGAGGSQLLGSSNKEVSFSSEVAFQERLHCD